MQLAAEYISTDKQFLTLLVKKQGKNCCQKLYIVSGSFLNFLEWAISFQVILTFNQSNQPNTDKEPQKKVCPYCGQSSQTVFVHGHEQCVFCKTNVEPCCQGEVQESD